MNPRAPRVTLLHGFLGSPADWADVLRELRPDIACDAPTIASFDPSSVAAAARGLAAHLEARACDLLVGYSMGGRIALELAATRPELAPRLLLLSASPGIEDEDERAARRDEDDRRAAELLLDGLARFAERWYAMPLFAPLRAHAAFAEVRARRVAGDAAFWGRTVAAYSPGRSEPRYSALPALAPRTVLAVGALDAKYGEVAARAARIAPALRVETVAGAGHVLPIEAPAACARLIESALAIETGPRTP
ncbi:MAG: alpha/beta fold hydrolase [Planctomycetota bacterium]